MKFYLKTDSGYVELAGKIGENVVVVDVGAGLEHGSDAPVRRLYGPIKDDRFGEPYAKTVIPVGDCQRTEDMREGLSWQAYEVRREYVTRYEEAVLQPADEVFGEQ